MARNLVLTLLLALPLAVSSARAEAETEKPDPARLEFFEKKVRPVLENHCLACHGAGKQKAGLRLDSRAAMLRGGESGPVVQPKDPAASRLIEAIHYDADTKMPPKGKLAAAEIAALTEWVRTGAVWPEAASSPASEIPAPRRALTAQDRAFWAFQPVKDQAPPQVQDVAWPKSPIDRFILARLEAKGLRPVEPADKRTLLRRASFDLTGLPPTIEEVEAFLADDAPDAFARVVDRLLASPHYGERWGRHWLDVARYGEDQAHTFEARKYPYGYRYRDWVVKALNADMPYDEFVRTQIAGDQIEGPGREERLAALGFFALGPVYYGKAVYDELDDRVDTLCRGFLGLTVACARCHDHKFDPVPQQDYYSLAGIFASTEYKEYPNAPAEVAARYEQGQTAIKEKNDRIKTFLKAESTRWTEAKTSEIARYMVAAWTLRNARKGNPKLATDEFSREHKLVPFVLDRWLKFLDPESDRAGRHPALARWNSVVREQDPAKDLSGDEAARANISKTADAFQAYVEATARLRDAIARHEEAVRANAPASDSPGPSTLSLAPPEADLLGAVVSGEGLFALPKNEVERQLPESSKAALKALRADLEKAKKEAPAPPPVTHALAEGPSPANMKIHLRGNPATPGAEAPRRFLAILAGDEAPAFSKGSGRLELARAIARAENPLTARVLVNRVWEHHFGRGIVATPSNFGKQGERPSHPELLDHLAHRFVARGWSLKALHREIMLSSTYQLSARNDPRNQEADPDNVLLGRANRRRLEVEAWRDAMLAVTGGLDPALGGPSIDLASASNRRRTVYAAVSRHDLDGLLRLFDFPDPNLTSDKRSVTTVPLQQLFVLNSEFMVRQAKALAALSNANQGEPEESRVRRAFLRLYARPATDREVRAATEFLSGDDESPGSRDDHPLSRWEQLAQVLLAANEFLYVD